MTDTTLRALAEAATASDALVYIDRRFFKDDTTELVAVPTDALKALLDRAERAEAENKRLRTALESFAMPSSDDPNAIPVAMQDIARVALAAAVDASEEAER